MLTVVLIGTAMIVMTVVLESFFIATAAVALERVAPRLVRLPFVLRSTVLLSALTLWLLAGISIALWMWAYLFVFLGEFESIEPAVYFSSVSATTLGYGDTLLSERWQLLSGFIAANGLVLFSLNTAFLFEALRQFNSPPKT